MTHSFNTDGGIHEIPLDAAVGRMWLCGKHFIAPRVEEIREQHSIDRVVCLVEEHELAGRYDPYVQWHTRSADAAGLWFPIPDLSYPSLENAIGFIQELSDFVCNTGSIVVHCAAGIGRAGTTATAILMTLGMDAHDAIHHVRTHRPMAGPESGAQIEFIQQLDEYIRDNATHD
jgi:protein-tyrosine phosphatase